jgi:hypothetical protein
MPNSLEQKNTIISCLINEVLPFGTFIHFSVAAVAAPAWFVAAMAPITAATAAIPPLQQAVARIEIRLQRMEARQQNAFATRPEHPLVPFPNDASTLQL